MGVATLVINGTCARENMELQLAIGEHIFCLMESS